MRIGADIVTRAALAAGGLEVLEVLEPGLQTTVQDLGRPGFAALGITQGGAADPWSMAVANALAGNHDGAATLEVLLAGLAVRAVRGVTVAIAGADLGAVTEPEGRRVPSGSSCTLAAGEVLRFTGPASMTRSWIRGARAYLAVPGGIEVPVVLGSRSTALGAGFGGVSGRALHTGDRLRAAGPVPMITGPVSWPLPAIAAGVIVGGLPLLRVMAGPAADPAGNPAAVEELVSRPWTVGSASDRVGLRLEGDPLPGAFTGDLASHGLVTGAIQVPPGGRPIVLLPDHQTTGGYPVIAVVIAADRPVLGQLAPGDRVRFARVERGEAVAALREMRAAFEDARAHLRDQRRWDDLAVNAGG